MTEKERTERAIALAREYYATDDVEIDDVPGVHKNDEGGFWVAAWVFVAPADVDGE